MRKSNSEKFNLNSKWENLGLYLEQEVAFVLFLQSLFLYNTLALYHGCSILSV